LPKKMKHAEVEERILGGTTARRGDVVITSGAGCWLYDEDG
jgi:4-aminobutyrate aminotransferase-like enzyme